MRKDKKTISNEQREKVKEKIAMKKTFTLLFVLCYLFFGNLFLFGQTADRLETLLQQE
jgi:preprotein translocase subunit SecY